MKYILTLMTLGLIGCSSKPHLPNGVEESIVVATDHSLITNDVPSTCVRSIPEPVLNEAEFPNAKFKLQADSLIGFETTALDNGDALTIKNWGCEYYTLTFQFETTRFQADTNDLAYWFEKAEVLLTGMLGGLDSPLDIKKGLMHLEYYIHHRRKKGSKGFNIGEQIDFGGTEIREFISIDRIAQLSEGKYLVEISVSTGPL